MPEQALPRLEALAGQLDQITDRLQKVADLAGRTRKLTYALVISFLLDVALTIVVTVLTLGSIHQGNVLHQSQLAACAAANDARAQQRQLWAYVTALSKGRPGQNQQEIRQFQAYVNHTFAPVDCVKLYP